MNGCQQSEDYAFFGTWRIIQVRRRRQWCELTRHNRVVSDVTRQRYTTYSKQIDFTELRVAVAVATYQSCLIWRSA